MARHVSRQAKHRALLWFMLAILIAGLLLPHVAQAGAA